MKTLFFTVYDYGQGDAWALIYADAKEEILGRYPCLEVLSGRPSWMDDATFSDFHSNYSFQIGDEPPDWLKMAMAKFQPGKPPSRRRE